MSSKGFREGLMRSIYSHPLKKSDTDMILYIYNLYTKEKLGIDRVLLGNKKRESLEYT